MTATADATDRSTITELAQTVETLKETVETQSQRIDELEEIVDQQSEQIEQLESQPEDDHIEVKSEGDTAGLKDIWIAGIPLGSILQNTTEKVDSAQIQIDELEEATTPNDAPEEGTTNIESNDSETPLERICGLPEHIVDRELTANQKRARFIARDVRDYAEKVPAGLFMDSQTIKKVIAAAERTKPHTQTVARVMDFLDDLGKEDIKVKKRQGKKFVVVDPEAANRYHSRCDRGNDETPGERVIGTV